MISRPGKARPRHRRAGESYDEKCERRHETRENLRRRNNVTTCRHLGRGAEEPAQSPRQREFLRRRNLASDAGGTPLLHIPQDPSSQMELRPPILLQEPRPFQIQAQE
ncbi:PREDICTED: TRAF3-interacting JNK-activating modulator-like [Pterocles gutturalis]|uniref:TRAF3-interacting JNK-activating modulator-like n=1 Tax=Pterocles gutturalis TaxID=240206 RepID=UPI0005293F97|nr:PREDICTED: TRAF3-interacting JNK-activating modulator-like [Pterocles gutturalis]